MRKSFFNRSGLLLIEIIIAILSFSVMSAVCLEAFVKAHNLAQDTRELDMAVRQSSSVAAIITQSDDPMKDIQKIYPVSDAEAHYAAIYFNKEFQACKESDSLYRMEISSVPTDEQTTSYFIAVYKNDSVGELYHLEITAYRQYTL